MENQATSPVPSMQQTAPAADQMPARDANNKAYYTLLDGEKIIFELTIDQASRTGFDVSSFVSIGKLKGFILDRVEDIPIVGKIVGTFLNDVRQGVFAVTNMRCIVSQVTVTGCSHREKQRTFWAFPRSAMNQSVSYEKMYVNKCCFGIDFPCCKRIVPEFELEVGLTIGNESEFLKLAVNGSNMISDDQAFALCAKIAELGQHAKD